MKTFKIIILFMLVGSFVSVSAQQKKAIKVGTINSQELLDLMPEYDSIQTVYEKEYKEIEMAGQQMYADLQRLQDDYRSKVDSLTPFMKSMKIQEIEDLTARLQGFEQNAQQQLQLTIQRLQQPIIDKIKKAIDDVAKENGYTHVFDTASGALLYFDESYDLMSLVKTKLGIKDAKPTTPAGN
jgi:outer membrane protein